jgi:hypothetical protein
MKRFSWAALLLVYAAVPVVPARAGEQEAKAVIDKAIMALGGEEKLAAVKAFSAKGKGTVVIDGSVIPFNFQSTSQGLDRYRSTFEAEVDGNRIEGTTVLDGDKGWQKFGEETEKLEGDKLANEKQNAYIEIVPVLLLPLKGKGFKVDSAPDEKVDDKPAAVVVATGPDGKPFTLYFDKESGLPVKLSARVVDWEGEEYTQDTTFEDYKEFGGIKVATKSKSLRDGKRYVDVEGVEFNALAEVDPNTFAEPK